MLFLKLGQENCIYVKLKSFPYCPTAHRYEKSILDFWLLSMPMSCILNVCIYASKAYLEGRVEEFEIILNRSAAFSFFYFSAMFLSFGEIR